MNKFTQEELAEALRAIFSMISKCKKVQKKLANGTPQKTLMRNRLKALNIASALVTEALRGS